MGPSRKKPRTEPPSVEESPTAPSGESCPPTPPKPIDPTTNDTDGITKSAEATASPLKAPIKSEGSQTRQIKSKSSWYGTWPRKSIASTSVARETILADKPTNGSSADLSRFEPKKASLPPTSRPPSMYIGKSKETLDITMGGTLEEEGGDVPKPEPRPDQTLPEQSIVTENQAQVIEEPMTGVSGELLPGTTVERPATSSGWLGGWLSRAPLQQAAKVPKSPEEATSSEQISAAEEQPVTSEPDLPVISVEDKPAEDGIGVSEVPRTSSSWFGLWPTAVPSVTDDAPSEELPIKMAESGSDTLMQEAPALEQSPQKAAPVPQAAPAAGSSWAFWSTDSPKKTADSTEQPGQSGQLAVVGEISQSHPEPAKTATVKENKKGKSTKRGRAISLEVDQASQKTMQSEISTPKSSTASTTAPSKISPPNLLIPSVRSTYRLAESPGILQQIARLLLHSHQQPSKHVFLVKEPPKIKKALAIGIHGLFPAPILRTVIGQPTGTSIRFANHAAAAIRRWTDKNGSIDCEIEKVALEGEGRIGERVDNLWKLLLNWIDHVRSADFILVACHSQGVPVALMLIAKLIEFGVVSTGRIGVCAMAGVSLGPFADYKSKLFSGSAGELFEFADPESIVSKRYEDALRVATHYGVRITYCGSIDDQLVSMESAIFSPASHPYIYRSVFVDGRIHAPDFLSHLVGFALKLRNLGVPDHGLIRELSAPLAGSLYTGEGHSRLYDDGNVYDLAIEFALETTSVADVPLTLQKYEVPTNANPYVLPWIMRGLLEEDFVKTELDHETTELLKQFDNWKPATKVLKDVKYRLEAVRSKL